MRIELQKELIEKYPKIFREIGLSPQATAMCWGFDCEDGWFWLIDKLCEFFIKIYKQTGAEVIAKQVKEKYGGLRFYHAVHHTTKDAYRRISRMARFFDYLSYSTCEICGNMGQLSVRVGWYKTLCEFHKEKLDYDVYEWDKGEEE